MDRTDMMLGIIWPENDSLYNAVKHRTDMHWGELDLAQHRESLHDTEKVTRIYEFKRPPASDGPAEGGCREWHRLEMKQRRESREGSEYLI